MKKVGVYIFLILNLILCIGAVTLFAFYPPPHTATSLFEIDNQRIRAAEWGTWSCLGVQCELCPFRCFLPEGARGLCKVRMNTGSRLKTLVYAQPVTVHVDPIEKKPVYHMKPGSKILSIATVGCNLKCSFCQNWELSQSYPEKTTLAEGRMLSPEQVVALAKKYNCNSIAYTYSEPIIFYEYVMDVAKLAKKNGLKNVMVSAGYINPEPLRKIAPYFDVVKVDLKGFNKRFYRDVVGGRLEYVLETLKELKKQNVLTEIVNLVVPGLNDDPDEIKKMCEWIFINLGPDTPLFFSRFTPQYKLNNLPVTPVETLEKAREIALRSKLKYVYLGNVAGHKGENTFCPSCSRVLVRRYGYSILANNIQNGSCRFCGEKIPGLWDW